MASSRTGPERPVIGCPASRLTRSPCVRCRSVAAASRSITWNGGTLARLATWNRSVMGRGYGRRSFTGYPVNLTLARSRISGEVQFHRVPGETAAACRPARRPKNDPSPSWVPEQ